MCCLIFTHLEIGLVFFVTDLWFYSIMIDYMVESDFSSFKFVRFVLLSWIWTILVNVP